MIAAVPTPTCAHDHLEPLTAPLLERVQEQFPPRSPDRFCSCACGTVFFRWALTGRPEPVAVVHGGVLVFIHPGE